MSPNFNVIPIKPIYTNGLESQAAGFSNNESNSGTQQFSQ